MYLVENDIGDDFETIRGRFPDIKKTEQYNHWLYKKGFIPIKRFRTEFEFKTLENAKMTFGSIWGEDVIEKIKDKKIGHNIIIFKKSKQK